MITVTYNRAEFSAQFAAVIERAKNPAGVLAVAGRELANRLREHFRKKERDEPNKLSPRRQHFWLQVMRSVNAPVQRGRTVSVTISHPAIAQKVFGGEIRAKQAGALTIPVSEKAYGRTASTFERETGLKLILLKKAGSSRAVLAAKVEGKIEVEYLLRKSVKQAPDADALPPESDLEAAILERAQQVVDREI
jgi:hypothetical protein